MKRTVLVLILVCIWLGVISAAAIISVAYSIQSSDKISTLLLNGKTASAVSAKKTAEEVKALIKITNYDHVQTKAQFKAQAQGNKIIALAIDDIEKHLDKSLKKDIDQSAKQVEQEIQRSSK